jgi:adenylosuccinate synthase
MLAGGAGRMPAAEVVLGLQWGDEGKGKVVAERAAGAAAVVRYQGGANAGHTLVEGGRTHVLHQVPCGAVRGGVRCIIAAGCAVDPFLLRAEVAALAAAGHALGPERLVVAARAQVVLPWMRAADRAEEGLRGSGRLGTTGRGIGPAYAAKAGRWGIQVGAWVEPRARAAALRRSGPWRRALQGALGARDASAGGAVAETAGWLRPFVADDLAALQRACAAGRVVFEGQLGIMRDPDRGAYPFCTGAPLLPPLALCGPSPQVLGVAKAYVTAVGAGPLPTEADPAAAAALRALGAEFGATTGRPRRCGWLDLPALRYAARAAGATALAVTKGDLAARLGEVPVCVRYADWDEGGGYPLTHELAAVRPVYETWGLGGGPVAFARRLAAAVGLPLAYAGTGPGTGEGQWFC